MYKIFNHIYHLFDEIVFSIKESRERAEFENAIKKEYAKYRWKRVYEIPEWLSSIVNETEQYSSTFSGTRGQYFYYKKENYQYKWTWYADYEVYVYKRRFVDPLAIKEKLKRNKQLRI